MPPETQDGPTFRALVRHIIHGPVALHLRRITGAKAPMVIRRNRRPIGVGPILLVSCRLCGTDEKPVRVCSVWRLSCWTAPEPTAYEQAIQEAHAHLRREHGGTEHCHSL